MRTFMVGMVVVRVVHTYCILHTYILHTFILYTTYIHTTYIHFVYYIHTTFMLHILLIYNMRTFMVGMVVVRVMGSLHLQKLCVCVCVCVCACVCVCRYVWYIQGGVRVM